MVKSNPSSKISKAWYKSKLAIILLLIFIFPVGAYLMWKYSGWGKSTKIALSIVMGLFFVLVVYSATNPTPDISLNNVKDGRISTDNKDYIVSGTVYPIDAVVTVNSKDALRSGNRFSANIELKEGDNQITVKVVTKNKVTTDEQFIIHRTTAAEMKTKLDSEKAAKEKTAEAAAKKADEDAAKKQAEADAAANKKAESDAAAAAAEKANTIASLFPVRAEAEKIARAYADKEWGTDYEMVKYTFDNQMEAYDWLVSQTEHRDIMEGAIREWGTDYEMVKYTYNNQVEAYNSLH